jgi:hypothetical protein
MFCSTGPSTLSKLKIYQFRAYRDCHTLTSVTLYKIFLDFNLINFTTNFYLNKIL